MIHVIVVEEAPAVWSVLGVEIDYAAGGESRAAALHNFNRGLALTIAANLRKFGSIDRLLRTRMN